MLEDNRVLKLEIQSSAGRLPISLIELYLTLGGIEVEMKNLFSPVLRILAQRQAIMVIPLGKGIPIKGTNSGQNTVITGDG